MTAPALPPRRRIADSATVTALLASGHTIAQVERATAWPAAAVRRLIDAREWRLQPDGRVTGPAPDPARQESCREPDRETARGYRRHSRQGDPACDACLEGYRAYKQQLREREAA